MNVIGFDDGPFERTRRGKVLLVGAVCAGTRLDGVVTGKIDRDGTDSTGRMVDLVQQSQFAGHVRALVLQGIAVGGFNVVDVHGLSRELGVPVVVVMRRLPDMAAIRKALFSETPPYRPRVRGARAKWQLIEAAGPPEPIVLSPGRGRTPSGLGRGVPRLFVQRAGLSLESATRLLSATTLHGHLPEPLRLAHLIAGGVISGKSRGRA